MLLGANNNELMWKFLMKRIVILMVQMERIVTGTIYLKQKRYSQSVVALLVIFEFLQK